MRESPVSLVGQDSTKSVYSTISFQFTSEYSVGTLCYLEKAESVLLSVPLVQDSRLLEALGLPFFSTPR